MGRHKTTYRHEEITIAEEQQKEQVSKSISHVWGNNHNSVARSEGESSTRKTDIHQADSASLRVFETAQRQSNTSSSSWY
jgi:hypothetical protein